MAAPGSSDTPGCFDILERRKSQGGTRKPLSGSHKVVLAKNIKSKKNSWCGAAFGGLPAERGWRNSGLSQGAPHPAWTPPQPWLCSHPALLPAKPVAVCQDPSPAQGPSLLLLLRSAAPGMCWGNQSWSLIPPKISMDTKSRLLSCSQAAVSCTGQTQTVHQANASHMPLFAKLQDFFTGTVHWCFRPV